MPRQALEPRHSDGLFVCCREFRGRAEGGLTSLDPVGALPAQATFVSFDGGLMRQDFKNEQLVPEEEQLRNSFLACPQDGSSHPARRLMER